MLELKNGQALNGKYVGGTAGTIRFETGGGTQVIETAQATALTFTGGGTTTTAPAPAATPAATAAPAAAAPSAVSVPAGTTLLVRMVEGASSSDAKGKRFTTTLETDLVAGGAIVAKAGTKVYGRVESAQGAGRYAGQSSLDLRLSELTVGGSLVPIITGPYAQAGAKSVGKTAKGAAGGAAIGAVASGLKKGEAVKVAPGTMMEFQLQQPVNVSVAR